MEEQSVMIRSRQGRGGQKSINEKNCWGISSDKLFLWPSVLIRCGFQNVLKKNEEDKKL